MPSEKEKKTERLRYVFLFEFNRDVGAAELGRNTFSVHGLDAIDDGVRRENDFFVLGREFLT